MRWVCGASVLVLAVLTMGSAAARAATTEEIGSFDEPIYLTSDPGNPQRLFVVERAGRIIEVQNGTERTFSDISFYPHCQSSCAGERGLLSIALAPDFDSSGRLFVDYGESNEPGDIHLAELTVVGDEAPEDTLRNILTIPHPNYSNDYGGQLQFGPEGLLFASTGDGGGIDDAEGNAHDLGSALGKILRLNPRPSEGRPYTIPQTNPFVGNAYPRSLIWSYGLRNPFRFSFDRSTGDMLIADVGESRQEEIDLAPAPSSGAGADYGWNCLEGLEVGPGWDPECGSGSFSPTMPVFTYPHSDPGNGGASGCAVIGGYVARGPGLGELENRYVYGDHCTGQVRSFCPASPGDTDRSEEVTIPNLVSFGEDSAGRLYAISADGPVYRLAAGGPPGCISPGPAPLAPSSIGIGAPLRRVQRHHRALIRARVTPCKGRKGEPVTLSSGRRPLLTRRLNDACVAKFRPRIDRRSRLHAAIAADSVYRAARSRALTIRVARRKLRR